MLSKEKIASIEMFKGFGQEELDEVAELCEKNNHIGFLLMQKVATVIGDRLTKQQAVFIKEVGDSLHFKW